MTGRLTYSVSVTRQPPGDAPHPDRVLDVVFTTKIVLDRYEKVLAYLRNAAPPLLDLQPGSRFRVVAVHRVVDGSWRCLATNGAGDLAGGEWW